MSSSPSVVLITGASSGIGRATAVQRAGDGHHLVLVARGEEDLATVAAECDAAGAASTPTRSVDVGIDSQVEDAVRDVLARHGRIDEVVSAAGVAVHAGLGGFLAPIREAAVKPETGALLAAGRAMTDSEAATYALERVTSAGAVSGAAATGG